MDFATMRDTCAQQEALLRFDSFDSQTAWALGSAMVEELKRRDLKVCVAIWSLTGYVLFQYAAAGTTVNNQNWMQRKYNSVCLMERSSLASKAIAALSGEGVEQCGLNPREYVFCGGGFPIRLKTGELVAVALASGLPDVLDHGFLVDCLSAHLGVEAPAIPLEEN